jgi:OFA family oxalate/formate antiporter-like MFS transporter
VSSTPAKTVDRVSSRAIFPVVAVVMNLCLGTLYAFSVFRNKLRVHYLYGTAEQIKDKTFKAGINEVGWAFTIAIVFFAVGLIIAGRWQDKVGPKKPAMVGGLLLGAGLLLAWITGLPEGQIAWLYIFYGVLGGLGIGFAYVTPLATCLKWFPDKRGAITGLAVFGFGGGSTLFSPVGQWLLGKVDVTTTLGILGLIFLVLVVGCGTILRNPPAGYVPKGWTPPAPAAGAVAKAEYKTAEMMRTPQFYFLWLAFLVGAAVGLMVISQASPMGTDKAGLSASDAAWAVGILGIFNAIGRIFHGWLSDRIGRKATVAIMFVEFIIALEIILRPESMGFVQYVAGISLIGLSFGAFLAIMPAFTADFFGTKNVGLNYAALFTAYGVAGIFGPKLADYVKAHSDTGDITGAFIILAVASVVGIVFTLLTKAPKAKALEKAA